MNTENIRLSDEERSRALQALGRHFADGRLTLPEFDERTAKAATATTFGELSPLFADLPGGMPKLNEVARLDGPSLPATRPATEVENLRSRGAQMKRVNSLLFAAGFAGFAVGTFVFAWSFSWVFFLLVPIGMAIARFALQYDKAEQKAFTELERVELAEKEKRLKQAIKRVNELEK